MVKEVLCPVCAKDIKGEERLRKHMLSFHPTDPITFDMYPDLKQKIQDRLNPDEMINPIKRLEKWSGDKYSPREKLEQLDLKMNMVNDTLDFMFKHMPTPYNRSNPYGWFNQQQPQQPQEDDFDKALSRMIKIMMIKQLMGSNENGFLSNFMQMSEFLDKKYEDRGGGGELQTLISAFLGSGLKGFGFNSNRTIRSSQTL